LAYFLLSYYSSDTSVRSGILLENSIYDLAEAAGAAHKLSGINAVSLVDVFKNWEEAKPDIEAIAATPIGTALKLSDTSLAAPVQYPGVLYMAGANYADHLLEMTGKPPPDKSKCEPFFFLKTTDGTIIGPNETIKLPAFSKKVDWEVEIAVVIGKKGRHIPLDQAMGYIAGYTIINDVSARDKSRRDDVPFIFDWIGQKCFDTSAPMGPWITPADQIGDPENLSLKLWVNDTLHQDSNTQQMFFKYAEQISYLSEHVTLNPGDVIATGTPAGVGHGKGEYLKDGDVVRIVIEGIGELINPCVQE
jgi:2-keto-4-pentenoate hydratase/2-oxohepta-3-ene-1,7-dioic acid hydratase in catechol pathway